MAGADKGPSWTDSVAQETWALFPDCVVVVNGEYLGTKAYMDEQIAYAFEADQDGRLPDDPDLIALRIANSLEIALE